MERTYDTKRLACIVSL